jgi:mannonate dehydratase
MVLSLYKRNMALEQTWRWYGPKDPITLAEIKQTGATGIVTALHHIPNGQVWPIEEIKIRIAEIEAAGLRWSVVESVPVHEDIKKQKGNYLQYIENYKESIHNLGICGIDTICYNFMPVLDWSRTDLEWVFADGSKALKFDMNAFAAFDIYILKREGAAASYTDKIQKEAKEVFESMDDAAKQKLIDTVIKGLPGSEESWDLESFGKVLKEYDNIDTATFKKNLFYFLQQIIPVAEQAGVRMAIHPDDPPYSLLGLPRIVSNIQDATELCNVVDSPSNGITLCTGSYGAGFENNLIEITEKLGHRINFVHLRNVTADAEGNFYEDDHLAGSVDMYGVMVELVKEEEKRKKEGREDWQMPMRPDHGHQMLDDLKKVNNPGYSLIGRMRGLAELRGLEMGIRRSVVTQ